MFIKLNENHRAAKNKWMEDKGLTLTSAAKELGVTLASFRKYQSGGGMHEATFKKFLKIIAPYMPPEQVQKITIDNDLRVRIQDLSDQDSLSEDLRKLLYKNGSSNYKHTISNIISFIDKSSMG